MFYLDKNAYMEMTSFVEENFEMKISYIDDFFYSQV